MRLRETPVPIPNTMVKAQAADGTMLETAWESRWVPDSSGGVAQLGEHLPCKQGVKSSNLSISIGRKQLRGTKPTGEGRTECEAVRETGQGHISRVWLSGQTKRTLKTAY